MKTINEVLNTGIGTEGQLLIPRKMHDQIIGEVEKRLIPRSEAALYIGPSGIPGSSYDVDFEDEDSLNIRMVGEGSEFIIANSEYTSTNYKPLKYGIAIRITREMMEDSKWDLLARNIKTTGKRISENENRLVITALDGAANTIAGGATVTLGNMTRGMQYIEDADMEATTIIVGNEVMTDIRNIDTFVEVNKSGSNEMLTRGTKGILLGMKVVRVSTNAGMTTTSAYIIDNEEAYIIIEKRPVSIEGFKLEIFDMEGAVVSQRITAGLLKSAAVCKITSS